MGKLAFVGGGVTAPENLPPIGKALNDYTWEEISTIAKAGKAADYFSVGDTKKVTLNGTFGGLTVSNLDVECFILGFDHNAEIEGINTIHFQFCKIDGVDVCFNISGNTMNSTNTNSGGWQASKMRGTVCPEFKAALTTELQSVIVPCTKYSDNTGGTTNAASNVTATTDDIWLLSEFEVTATANKANSAEQDYQKQYDYYKAGNSIIKYKHDAKTTAYGWRLRSCAHNDAYSWCYVYSTGFVTDGNAIQTLGFAPCFMVGAKEVS